MLRTQTEKVLKEFAESVFAQARTNLAKQNVTNDLSNSFKSTIKENPNSITLAMEMAEHGFYQDEGIKGKKSSSKAPNSRFKFGKSGVKGSGVLRNAIERWVKSRRIQFRNYKTGRFMTYKQTARTAAYFIYNRGIKPSKFMTKALEKEFKTLPDELVEAYGLDIDKFLEFAFKDNIKSIK